MGRNVEIHSYNFDGLVNDIAETVKTDRKDIIEDILLTGGDKIGDRYILLNNEFWEEFNSYFMLSGIINKAFRVDDECGKIFDCFCHNGKDSIDWHEINSHAEFMEYEDMLKSKYDIEIAEE